METRLHAPGYPASALLAAALLLTALPARAEPAVSQQVYIGGDLSLGPHLGGHGIVKIAFDISNLVADSHLTATFNTDTLELTWHRIRLGDTPLEAGLRIKAEFLLAGLLTDYYRRGTWDGERGFLANYVGADAHLKANLPGYQHLELAVGGRRWFFWRSGREVPGLMPDTAGAFRLPTDAWVVEPRLRYTLWRLQDDPSLHGGYSMFPRVRGVALGLALGLDVRDRARPWGARDPDRFDPRDPRNDPENAIVLIRQWMRAGYQMRPSVRLQFAEWSGWGYGEDDLTRTRIGGMNPYVVPAPGAPWAAFLSDGYVVLEGSGHFRIAEGSEVGVLINGAFIEDIERVGRENAMGSLVGLGLFADLRVGSAQIDVRMGWSPLMNWRSPAGQWSLFVGLGWLTERARAPIPAQVGLLEPQPGQGARLPARRR